eukprot:g4553.t1
MTSDVRAIKSLHEFHPQRWSVTTIPHLEMLLQRNDKALHEEMTIWNSFPVYYAVICGAKLEVVEWLVEKTGKEFVKKLEFSNNWNFIHFCAYRNHPHLIPYLLDLLGTETLRVETTDSDCFTPMEFAKDLRLKKKKRQCVALLKNPEETIRKYQERVEDEVQYMIWDLHSKYGWDESDLSYIKKIVRKENKRLKEEYIKNQEAQKKKNKKSRRNSRSPSPSRTKTLHRSQSSLTNSTKTSKKTLRRGIKSMQNINVNMIEKNKVTLDPPNILHQHGGDDDEIPIYYAIRYGSINVDFKIYTELCTQSGFDVCKNYQSKNGFTLMHWAICNESGPSLEFIEWLGKEVMGDDVVKAMRMPYIDGPTIRFHKNDTLLHEAAKYQRVEVIPYLLTTLGIEALKIKNKDGLLPVDISKKRGSRNEDVEDLLIYPTKTLNTYAMKFKKVEVKLKSIQAFTNPFKKKKRPSIVNVPEEKNNDK